MRVNHEIDWKALEIALIYWEIYAAYDNIILNFD